MFWWLARSESCAATDKQTTRKTVLALNSRNVRSLLFLVSMSESHWSNPSATASFASLSADQIKNCIRNALRSTRVEVEGGNGGFGITPGTLIPIFLTSCSDEGCSSYWAGWWYIPGTVKGPTY